MQRISLIIIFSLFYFSVYSQIIELKGRIIDKNTQTHITGVSVQIGEQGTITNSKGEFRINISKDILEKKGITFSCIGYVKKHLNFVQDNFFITVELETYEKQLTEVVVTTGARKIVEKAIERIPVNYPTKPTIITGIARFYFLRNNNKDYYKSDAVVKLYTPSYLDYKNDIDVKLVQNKVQFISDPSLNDYINWRGGYLTPAYLDFVHNRASFINPEKMNSFVYSLKGKSFYENTRVFVIDFYSKQKVKGEFYKNIQGTLYIDTATYAFVAANSDLFDIKKFPYIPTAKRSHKVSYQKIREKWYLKSAHSEGNHLFKNQFPFSSGDFVFVSLDTVNVSPFSYLERLQETDITQQLNKEAKESEWVQYDSIFVKEEIANNITKIPVPKLDTLNQQANKFSKKYNINSFNNMIINYLRSDNVLFAISMAKLPVNANNNALTEFGIGLSVYYRLYKDLFLQTEDNRNYGIGGGASSMLRGWYLVNNFPLNKNGRPITISPYGGYTKIKFSDKKAGQKKTIHNWTAGLNTSIELTRKKSYFISCAYNNTFKESNSPMPINITQLSFSTGIIFRLN